MPPRSKAKPRRKNRKKEPRLVIQRSPVIADSQMVTMRYHESVLINPAAGLAGNYIFRANSIFDPNYTGAGHQPIGHDEWAVFYNKYAVVKSTIKASFVSQNDVASTGTALVGIGLQHDTFLEANPDTIIERRDATTKVMTALSAQGVATVVGKSYTPDRFFMTKHLVDDPQLRAAFNMNPTADAYYNVFMAPLVGADVASTAVSVVIDYTVLLTDRTDLTGS